MKIGDIKPANFGQFEAGRPYGNFAGEFLEIEKVSQTITGFTENLIGVLTEDDGEGNQIPVSGIFLE